jgi:hypothetical protein
MTSSSANAVDPSLCPVCGEPNTCAMSQGKAVTECWCFGAPISESALQRIPSQAKNLACVCPRCAALQTDAKIS